MKYAKPAITFSAQADLLLARDLEGASKAQLVAKLDAIERAEVAIHTRIVNQHALAHGPFGYLDRANLPGLQVHEHRDLLDRIREEARRSRDDRIFGLLSVLRYLLRQTAPASAWPERLKAVLAAYPDIPLADMGFPESWEQSPIWH